MNLGITVGQKMSGNYNSQSPWHISIHNCPFHWTMKSTSMLRLCRSVVIASWSSTTITCNFALLIPYHLIRPKYNLNQCLDHMDHNQTLDHNETLYSSWIEPFAQPTLFPSAFALKFGLDELLQGGFNLEIITGESDK